MTGAIRGIAVLLAALLAGCASSDSLTYGADDSGPQKFPENYRAEILALMRTYLNDPRGVKDAFVAEPAQRTVGGRPRYVACLRYNARKADGGYDGIRTRGALFVQGRLDRIIDRPDEYCEGATYTPFPDMEKMTR